MEENKPIEPQVINAFLKCYLIGAMEKTKANDSGRGWRDKLRPELQARLDQNGNPIYIFDPTREEQNKVGMEPKEFHSKMMGWIQGGNNDLISENHDLVWHGKTYIEFDKESGKGKLVHIMGDIDYVLNSDFLICRFEEGDSPCGTYGEACVAFMHKIPIYVIQTMPRDKYPISFIGWVFASKGEFFDNPTQLLEFLDKKYKLKSKG